MSVSSDMILHMQSFGFSAAMVVSFQAVRVQWVSGQVNSSGLGNTAVSFPTQEHHSWQRFREKCREGDQLVVST
jgi:hypothetical protein